jgi:hypothetical protein
VLAAVRVATELAARGTSAEPVPPPPQPLSIDINAAAPQPRATKRNAPQRITSTPFKRSTRARSLHGTAKARIAAVGKSLPRCFRLPDGARRIIGDRVRFGRLGDAVYASGKSRGESFGAAISR